MDWDEVTRLLTAEELPARRALFPLGRHVITLAVVETVTPLDVCLAALRHSRGVWGELDEAGREANERSLREGGELVSAHHARNGTCFYVVTEHDRSVTHVLVPEELMTE
jgi:hypothetical protein